jgi:hypothetical protein
MKQWETENSSEQIGEVTGCILLYSYLINWSDG